MTARLNLHDTLMHHTYVHDTCDDDLRGPLATKIRDFPKFLRAVISSHTVMSRRAARWGRSLTTVALWFLAVTALDFGDRKAQLGDR